MESKEDTLGGPLRGKGRKEQAGESSRSSSDETIADSSEVPAIPESRYDLLVLQSMRRIIRAVDIYSRKLRATHKLTAPQLICLLNIVEQKRTTATRIAREVYLNPSTVVGILDRLELQGLVVRDRDSRDRRVVNVAATAEGRKVAQSAPSPLQDSLAEALNQLPVSQRAEIASSLKRIVNLMEAHHLTAAPILETDQLGMFREDTGENER
jgi:DNA-binding MarR family transcriptional regulator